MIFLPLSDPTGFGFRPTKPAIPLSGIKGGGSLLQDKKFGTAFDIDTLKK
jgi:hypothetical protein